MNGTALVVSGHALDRASERFPNIDIQAEINGHLTELGGQAGDSKAYLTSSDVVIIVKDGTVLTVMSHDMYLANVYTNLPSLRCKLALCDAVRKSPKLSTTDEVKLSPESVAVITNERREALTQEVREYAKKHLKDDIENQVAPIDSRKARHALMKSLGYTCKARKIYEEEYMKIYISMHI